MKEGGDDGDGCNGVRRGPVISARQRRLDRESMLVWLSAFVVIAVVGSLMPFCCCFSSTAAVGFPLLLLYLMRLFMVPHLPTTQDMQVLSKGGNDRACT